MSLHEAPYLSLVSYVAFYRRVIQKKISLQFIWDPIGGKKLPFVIFGFSETTSSKWISNWISAIRKKMISSKKTRSSQQQDLWHCQHSSFVICLWRAQLYNVLSKEFNSVLHLQEHLKVVLPPSWYPSSLCPDPSLVIMQPFGEDRMIGCIPST